MTSKFLHAMYNKTIIRFGLYDIQNNQGLGNQSQPSASADNPYIVYVSPQMRYPPYHDVSAQQGGTLYTAAASTRARSPNNCQNLAVLPKRHDNETIIAKLRIPGLI